MRHDLNFGFSGRHAKSAVARVFGLKGHPGLPYHLAPSMVVCTQGIDITKIFLRELSGDRPSLRINNWITTKSCQRVPESVQVHFFQKRTCAVFLRRPCSPQWR